MNGARVGEVVGELGLCSRVNVCGRISRARAAHLKLLDLELVLDSPLDGRLSSVLELAVDRFRGERHCSREHGGGWRWETGQQRRRGVEEVVVSGEGGSGTHSPVCVRETAVAVKRPIEGLRHRPQLNRRRERQRRGGWEVGREKNMRGRYTPTKGASCSSG